jgi:hypothetical protein
MSTTLYTASSLTETESSLESTQLMYVDDSGNPLGELHAGSVDDPIEIGSSSSASSAIMAIDDRKPDGLDLSLFTSQHSSQSSTRTLAHSSPPTSQSTTSDPISSRLAVTSTTTTATTTTTAAPLQQQQQLLKFDITDELLNQTPRCERVTKSVFGLKSLHARQFHQLSVR